MSVEKFQQQQDGFSIFCANDSVITTSQLIDCRVGTFRMPTKNFENYSGWWQSFLGYEVSGSPDFLDPDSFCLMDFETSSSHPLSFGYILPLSSEKTLVEFTVFDSEAQSLSTLESGLKNYLQSLNWNYENPLLKEHGWLPMVSDPSLHRSAGNSCEGAWLAGIPGNCARPSSGYAFARIQKQASAFARAIVREELEPPETVSLSSTMLDTVFMKAVLPDKKLARRSFKRLLEKTTGDAMAGFMGERYRLGNFVSVVKSLPKWPFMLAFSKVFLGKGLRVGSQNKLNSSEEGLSSMNRTDLWFIPPFLGAIGLLLLWLFTPSALIPTVGAGIFLGSILLLGMPHGAADISLAPLLKKDRFLYGKFLLTYGGLMCATFAAWIVAPVFAMIAFILLTIWHWGTADIVPAALHRQRNSNLMAAYFHGITRGGWIILGPLAVHASAVDDLLMAWGSSFSITQFSVLFTAFWLTFIGLDIVFAATKLRSDHAYLRWYFGEILFLVSLQFVLDPLWWIAVYFICFHSWRHSLRICAHSRPSLFNKKSSRWIFIPGSLDAAGKICWIMGSLLLLAVVLFRHGDLTSLSTIGWVGDYLILISALTVPHAILVAKLDIFEKCSPR